CAIASLILTLITRRIIQRTNINLAFVGIIYTALFALYAMLFWLAFF
ncbi:TPA: YtcA family lipoprotein, partial [Escherichia coli]